MRDSAHDCKKQKAHIKLLLMGTKCWRRSTKKSSCPATCSGTYSFCSRAVNMGNVPVGTVGIVAVRVVIVRIVAVGIVLMRAVVVRAV